MDYMAMATAVIGFLQPYVMSSGAEMAKGALSQAGKEVWVWLKSRFTKPAQQAAVADLEAAPQDAANWEALKLQLLKALRDDEAFRQELLARLPEQVKQSITQNANVPGNSNVVVQSAGGGTIHIQR